MSKRHAVSGLLSFALLALASTTAHAQFEGTISMRLSSTSGGSNMQYSVKGDRMRIDVDAAKVGGVYVVADHGKATMVMPAQKIYFEQPLPAVPAQAAADASKSSIKATGRMETIAGYKCEHFTITSAKEGQYDVCLSKELGTFMQPMNPAGGGSASDDVLAHLGGNAFPLKVQKVGGATSLEVTKIDKKPLAESLFTPPSDYKKLDVGAMRGGRPPQQ